MPHPALIPGAVAVITGGASGIGLAAAKKFAATGMKVCIADIGAKRLADARAQVILVASNKDDVMAVETDVSRVDDIVALERSVAETFGGVDVLMNNAGVQPGSALF